MKKSKLFKHGSVNLPKFHWHNKSHSNYLALPFGRVVPSFWSDVAPNESFRISEGTKLLTSPYIAPQLSKIRIKTRYFCVPLRKVVPSFVDFKLSDPSDNITSFHTTIYNLFRGACGMYGSYQQQRFFENLKVDGLANYLGIPWLLDQLCCTIFGKDMAFMREWTQALLADGGFLDAAQVYTDFDPWFYACILSSASTYSDQDFHPTTNLIWYKVATGGSAPTYQYTPENLAYYNNDTMKLFYLDFGTYMNTFSISWSSMINNVLAESDQSFDSYIAKVMHVDSGSVDIDSLPWYGVLSDATRGGDNTDTFFGTPVRLDPFLAYQKVRYDWFVDLRLNDNVFEHLCKYYEQNNVNQSYLKWNDNFYYVSDLSGSSVQVYILSFLLTSFVVDYNKDYFTTCSFEPQLGDDIVIGPQGKLPLMFEVETAGLSNSKAVASPAGLSVSTGDSGKLVLNQMSGSPAVTIGQVWAQINDSDEITPIKLRWQMAFQKLKEARNIGGYSRYTDFVLGQYGIRIPDPYLQRSVYLGGFRTSIGTNEVVARSDGQSTEGSSMLGDVGGYGRGYSYSSRIMGHVKEHCIVMAFTYIVPQNYYTQGISSRLTDIKVLDHPHHQFKNVGEQPVLNREIFLGAKPADIFGYQKRYSDKMFMFDEIHGEFLDNLRYWHTGRKFMNQPQLNQALLSLNGSDGHNDILALDPSVAMPFRIEKNISFSHKMCV